MKRFAWAFILAMAFLGSEGMSEVFAWPSVYPTSNRVVTTSGAVTTSSVQLVAENKARRAFYIWNNSANSAYITFGPTSSSATPTFILPTFATLVVNGPVVWTGPISAIRNSGTGTLTVTELK